MELIVTASLCCILFIATVSFILSRLLKINYLPLFRRCGLVCSVLLFAYGFFSYNDSPTPGAYDNLFYGVIIAFACLCFIVFVTLSLLAFIYRCCRKKPAN